MAETRELRPATILAKCEYFVDVQLWPIHDRLDVAGWLQNFTADDPHALHLLNSFLYYPEFMINPMVMRALKQLSPEVVGTDRAYSDLRADWSAFLDAVAITFPEGEEPNPTDSGYEFARRAREVGLREDQIVGPGDMVERLAAGDRFSGVVFVDDFVGTGNQFHKTWTRKYSGGSFREVHAASAFDAFYTPLFCTGLGVTELAKHCPEVAVRPLHLLTDRYSALNETGIVWPDSLAPTGPEFIEQASARAAIPDTGGAMPDDWRGFASLGLTIAFGRFVPDATLPLFYWKENGWRPLIERH